MFASIYSNEGFHPLVSAFLVTEEVNVEIVAVRVEPVNNVDDCPILSLS